MGSGGSILITGTPIRSSRSSLPMTVGRRDERNRVITAHSLQQSISSYFRPKLTDFLIGAVVGKGGFGTIREIQRKKDKFWFALKIYELNQITMREAELIVNELTVLNRLPRHPFVVRWYATFRDNRSLSFVLDLFPGGDLRLLMSLGERFTEQKTAYVIGAIGSALHHLHLHRIIHRDVKPENIMFDGRGVPKLIDFGISYVLPLSATVCICSCRSGTEQYASPEACVPETHYHGYETDFWSLGLVMYEMLFLELPYRGRVPSSFVHYSQERYFSTWTQIKAAYEGATTHLLNTSSCDTHAHNISSDTHALNRFVFDDDVRDFMFNIPDTTELNIPTSSACKDMLVSLLDVRTHRRLGVGMNYERFENHKWFLTYSIQLNSIDSVTSPIPPKFQEVAMFLWHKYFSDNVECSDGDSNSFAENPLPPHIHDYLQQIQLITPLDHESGKYCMNYGQQ